MAEKTNWKTMAQMPKMAKVFKFNKFARTAKMSQMAGMAKTTKRDFSGRKGRDSHIEQNDLSDQDYQIGPQWLGLAKKAKMAKLNEKDSVAKKSKRPN